MVNTNISRLNKKGPGKDDNSSSTTSTTSSKSSVSTFSSSSGVLQYCLSDLRNTFADVGNLIHNFFQGPGTGDLNSVLSSTPTVVTVSKTAAVGRGRSRSGSRSRSPGPGLNFDGNRSRSKSQSSRNIFDDNADEFLTYWMGSDEKTIERGRRERMLEVARNRQNIVRKIEQEGSRRGIGTGMGIVDVGSSLSTRKWSNIGKRTTKYDGGSDSDHDNYSVGGSVKDMRYISFLNKQNKMASDRFDEKKKFPSSKPSLRVRRGLVLKKLRSTSSLGRAALGDHQIYVGGNGGKTIAVLTKGI